MSQSDLFMETPPPKEDTEAKARAKDSFNLFMRARFGVSDAWQWKKVETLGDYETPRSEAFFQIDGAEYPEVYARGPKKGTTDYRKPKPGTERSKVVSFKDFDAFRKERGLE